MISIPVILGPTSSGKTTLALDICQNIGSKAKIISADSRQIFKYMDIGTGKLPLDLNSSVIRDNGKWLVDDVDIYGYDLAYPNEYFSAYDYFDWGFTKLTELLKAEYYPIIVGGTGFYIDLLTGRAKTSNIKPDFALRNELKNYTATQLLQILLDIKPALANNIDIDNPVRLIRAIEIAKSSQKPVQKSKALEGVEFSYFGLTSDRDTLYNLADNWVDQIWNKGIVDEVHSLINNGYLNTLPLQGIIYKDVISFINDLASKQEAIQKCKFALHAYIRRQQTWFKKNKEIQWFDLANTAQLADLVVDNYKAL